MFAFFVYEMSNNYHQSPVLNRTSLLLFQHSGKCQDVRVASNTSLRRSYICSNARGITRAGIPSGPRAMFLEQIPDSRFPDGRNIVFSVPVIYDRISHRWGVCSARCGRKQEVHTPTLLPPAPRGYRYSLTQYTEC